ncbi:MAG: hypothetical protein AAF092_10145 [Pseudomonadota bacterium]
MGRSSINLHRHDLNGDTSLRQLVELCQSILRGSKGSIKIKDDKRVSSLEAFGDIGINRAPLGDRR